MLKKVIAGIILIGLGAVLVAGAIRRTSDRLELFGRQGQESQNGNPGRNAKGGTAVQGGSGRGFKDVDQSASFSRAEGGNGYGHGQTADAGGPVRASSEEESGHDWLAFEGVVSSVDAEALAVLLDSGEQLLLEGRAWSFTQELGFTVEAGDHIVMKGFFEDGAYQVGELANLASGRVVLLREASGRPMWAGRGRRGS